MTSGMTLIELLVYLSLLGLVAHLGFDFALKIKRTQQKAWGAHHQMDTMQTAAVLLMQDLRLSQNLEVKRGKKISIICQMAVGSIVWQFQDNVLWRVDQQSGLKRPTSSKVLEEVGSLQIKSLKGAKGQNLIWFKLESLDEKLWVDKAVCIRSSLEL